MRLITLLSITVLALLSTPADAQPGLTPPGQVQPQPYTQQPYVQPNVQQQQPITREVSYGWHIFAVDVASWLVLSAAAEESEGLAVLGLGGMFLGGPIVHLAHGNGSSAAYSLLARVALPYGGALLLASTCDNDADSWDCLGPTILGGVLGYGTALALDWFVLARKTEVIAPATGWASLRPSLNVTPDSAHAGVAFQF